MKTLSLLAVVPLALVLAGTAFAETQPKVEDPKDSKVEVVVAVEAAVPVAVAEEADSCGELFTEANPETLLATNLSSAAPCKSCKNRTWCKCSYNGLPRVSCDPCCYGAYGSPTTCFD